MRPLWMIFFIALVAPRPSLQGQQLNTRSSFMLRSTVVTSSRVFNNPDAQDIVDRDHYEFVDNLLGGGLEYRLEFPHQNVLFTLSVEYTSRLLAVTRPFLTTGNQLVQLPVKQGVHFIPFELGAGTEIPLAEDVLQLTMGGGFGIYYANRVYEISGLSMKSESLPIGYGIHVESGLDYRIFENMGLRWEMRFRDPEVINESKFDPNYITVANNQISVGNIPSKSKINVHGVSFTLGVIVGFEK
jgi:hypothetical protein